MGTYAQYKCMPEDGALAVKPPSMTYEEAAPLPIAGQNSLHFMRLADIKEGDRVLVYGASGGFGTYAVQIAKHFGADVSAVCSAEAFDIVGELGAGRLFDYTKDDFDEDPARYDVIFDPLGFSPFSRCVAVLREGGRYLLANPSVPDRMRGRWTNLTSGKRVVTKMASENAEDLDLLRDIVEGGGLKTVIDSTFPLDRIADAHRYVERRTKIGQVVITVDDR